jgi:hypothetical protein
MKELLKDLREAFRAVSPTFTKEDFVKACRQAVAQSDALAAYKGDWIEEMENDPDVAVKKSSSDSEVTILPEYALALCTREYFDKSLGRRIVMDYFDRVVTDKLASALIEELADYQEFLVAAIDNDYISKMAEGYNRFNFDISGVSFVTVDGIPLVLMF